MRPFRLLFRQFLLYVNYSMQPFERDARARINAALKTIVEDRGALYESEGVERIAYNEGVGRKVSIRHKYPKAARQLFPSDFHVSQPLRTARKEILNETVSSVAAPRLERANEFKQGRETVREEPKPPWSKFMHAVREGSIFFHPRK